MKLKDYLHEKGIRQIELAKKIDAPVSVINVFVNGWKPLPEKHLANLARVLKVSIEELKLGEILPVSQTRKYNNHLSFKLKRRAHNGK